MEPGFFSHGWQFLAAKVVEQRFRSTVVWPRCTPTQQALLRSQSGRMSGLPFSAVPSSSSARFPAQLFRSFLFHLLRAPAGVAVSSKSLAITVQRVRGQVFLEVVVSPSRAQLLLGFAVRPAPASSSAIWTSLWTGAASRLLLMVYLCSVVPNWRSTPRSCRPSEQMGCLAVSAQTWMARHLLRPVVASSALILNLMATDELGWCRGWWALVGRSPCVREPISKGQGQVCAACLGWSGPSGLATPLGHSFGMRECPLRSLFA